MSYLKTAKRVLAEDPAARDTAGEMAPHKYVPGHTPLWHRAAARLIAELPLAEEEIAVLKQQCRSPISPWRRDEAAPSENLVELPDWPAPPCPTCGSLELWEDFAGGWRCRHCDPPTAAHRLRRLAERIRQRGTG